MAAKGWITVRDLAKTGKKSVMQVIQKFMAIYKVCPKCCGRGFNVDDEKVSCNDGVSSVKFNNYPELEKMYERGNLNGDTIKKIVETVVHGRQQCSKCNGFGFIKKSRKNKNEKSS